LPERQTELGRAKFDLQARWLELDAPTSHHFTGQSNRRAAGDGIHDIQQRLFLLPCQMVVVFNFEQRKGGPPAVGDEHRALCRSAFGCAHIAREIATGIGVNRHVFSFFP
jgi:hypothetical protein